MATTRLTIGVDKAHRLAPARGRNALILLVIGWEWVVGVSDLR
jgi:hypothetical protein